MGQKTLIALRKSDNPTDLILSDQHDGTPSVTFGIRPFPIDNDPRDLSRRGTLGQMRLYRMYPYDTTSCLVCQVLFSYFSQKSYGFGNTDDKSRRLFLLLRFRFYLDTASAHHFHRAIHRIVKHSNVADSTAHTRLALMLFLSRFR